ncbi:PilT/PilU family type 4a pilus ATPase, partial [bacterium]|nr:PilT/PilU family type 4a pilus ATPase [bacterium]
MADSRSVRNLLNLMYEKGASDLHLGVDKPPWMRIDGTLKPTDLPKLNRQDMEDIARIVLGPKREFLIDEQNEVDFSYSPEDFPGRFRVNFYRQKGEIGLALRLVTYYIPSFEELNLPKIIADVALAERGIIIITGTTGSGKSTTLAAMTDHVNKSRDGHVITIEDPIEYYHFDNKCIVNQREVGIDTDSFIIALRAGMREDPDVILVGEMRDLETISLALTAAETGHLVLSTLHTRNAPDTINRIIDVFPAEQQTQILAQISSSLLGIISQRLLPAAEGTGRVAAIEVLLADSAVRNMIRERKTHQIRSAMQSSTIAGMHTMD